MKRQVPMINQRFALTDTQALDLAPIAHTCPWEGGPAERDSLAQFVTKNAAVNATEQHEINEQVVNDIFLKTVAAGVDTFTSQQIIDLRDVAAQCPDCGGDAVFRARSLLAMHDPYSIFDDLVLCSDIEERGAKPEDALATLDFVVYPNPATNELTMILPDGPDIKGREFVLHSILGKEMLRDRLPENETKFIISTSMLPSGAYILSVLENNSKVYSQQVFIIK